MHEHEATELAPEIIDLNAAGKNQIYSSAVNANATGLIESLHPELARVIDAAIDAVAASPGPVTRIDAEESLALTLLPFVQEFAAIDSAEKLDDSTAPVLFKRITEDWIVTQTSSVSEAIVRDVLATHWDRCDGKLVSSADQARLTELENLLDQLADRPTYAASRRKLEADAAALVASIAARSGSSNPDQALALSFLLTRMDDRGRLIPAALAALIMNGNASPGRDATRTAVQILSPGAAAKALSIEKSKLVGRVSEIRKQALASTGGIALGRRIERPNDLWANCPVPHAA